MALQSKDLQSIKTIQNAAWSAGDFAKIGVTLQIVGEELAESMDLPTGSTVLDVAAGNGNATLAFARRFHKVTSTDFVPTLLDSGKVRARAEALEVEFESADVENLQFDNGSFDAVVSTFGIMFAPNQKQAASEMNRVTKPGGRMGMANWTPEGFIGGMFKTMAKHIKPAPGLNSPGVWGTDKWIGETFKQEVDSIYVTRKNFMFRYPTPQFFVDFFRVYYGPTQKAFSSLSGLGQVALNDDLLALVETFNTVSDGTMRVPAEYLEIVMTKTAMHS